MRAVVKVGAEPGCRFVTDRAEPGLRPGELRVEVAAASVCGTDAALYVSGGAGGDLGMTFPRIMGHEAAGRVVEVGSNCDGWAVGTRVALETHLHCDDCYFCRSGDRHNCAAVGILGVTVDGVFADRVVVPARSCFALPEEIGLHVGALLEPAGSAMHSVLRSGVDLAGASVLVTGAGPVGLVAAQIATALSARSVVVTEPAEHRRRLATELGLQVVGTEVEPVDVADRATRARGGFDVAFECSGALPALQTALAGVRREATVVCVGLVKDQLLLPVTDTLITRGLTLRGSWGRSIWATWDRLVALVVAGSVDLELLVTHRLPLSRLPMALDLVRSAPLKVLLIPAMPDEQAAVGWMDAAGG